MTEHTMSITLSEHNYGIVKEMMERYGKKTDADFLNWILNKAYCADLLVRGCDTIRVVDGFIKEEV